MIASPGENGDHSSMQNCVIARPVRKLAVAIRFLVFVQSRKKNALECSFNRKTAGAEVLRRKALPG